MVTHYRREKGYYQLMENIGYNGLWVSLIINLISNTKQVSTFSNIVSQVLVSALVRCLSKSYSRHCDKVINVKAYFSDANSESRSNSSKGGGGSSRRIGGKTAGSRPSKGVSN